MASCMDDRLIFVTTMRPQSPRRQNSLPPKILALHIQQSNLSLNKLSCPKPDFAVLDVQIPNVHAPGLSPSTSSWGNSITCDHFATDNYNDLPVAQVIMSSLLGRIGVGLLLVIGILEMADKADRSEWSIHPYTLQSNLPISKWLFTSGDLVYKSILFGTIRSPVYFSRVEFRVWILFSHTDCENLPTYSFRRFHELWFWIFRFPELQPTQGHWKMVRSTARHTNAGYRYWEHFLDIRKWANY